MADQRKDNQYWKSRFKAMENDQYRKSAAYYKDLQEQFRRAQNDIQMDMEHWYQRLADNNEISLAGAKRLLKGEELDEFHWAVDQYIKAGRENAVDQRWMKQLENASARSHISRLEAMKLQIQQHAEVLFTEYDSGVSEFLNKSYADQFYHTAFEIAKGTGVGSNLAAIDTRRIDTLIRQPWAQDGANFSDRIWSNKQKLVNTLHTELTQHIIRGSDPQQAIDNLARTMEVSRAQAGRLIMTESAAISSAATRECFKELEVDQYEILAALDSRTCDICQDLDGEVFTMKEYELGMTAPPFHPNCRCTTVPYFDDEFSSEGKRTARDPKTGKTTYVPANMKYHEWEEKYVSKDQRINNPEMLKLKGNFTGADKDRFNHEYALIPEVHRDLIEQEIKEIAVALDGNSRYNRAKGVLYLAPDLVEGETVHEMAHILETRLNVWDDPKFINAVKNTLGEEELLFYVIDDTDTFTKPIQRLDRENVLISIYQGRIYEEIGAVDENWKFNYYSLGDFFSEAYREYLLRPDVLKEKQPLIFSYIEGIK